MAVAPYCGTTQAGKSAKGVPDNPVWRSGIGFITTALPSWVKKVTASTGAFWYGAACIVCSEFGGGVMKFVG